MSDTIFDKIIQREVPSHIVWEDAKHIAFLTPFPNTPGVTVVIPKTNPGSNFTSVEPAIYSDLMTAARLVAQKLQSALGVSRVGLAIEGTGVPYLHVKLYPFHGKLADATNLEGGEPEFVEDYRGYFTTLEGPQMDDQQLQEIATKIRQTTER